MSWYHLLNDFKPRIEDRAFGLEERLSAHRITGLAVVSAGEAVFKQRLRRSGRKWDQEGTPVAGDPAVLLLSPHSLVLDVRDLPALPGGNTESALASAILEKPETLLRDRYEKDRRYHLVPFGGGRTALLFSVKDADVRRAEAEIARGGFKLVQAWCGMAQAVRFALSDCPSRFPNAGVLVVSDHAFCVTVNLAAAARPDAATMAAIRADDPDPLFSPASDLMEHLAQADDRSPTVVLYSTHFSVLAGRTFRAPEGVPFVQQTINSPDLCFG
jgi:hypothetical protein